MGQALGCGGGRKGRQDEEYEPQNSSSSENPKPRRATAPRVELNWSTVFGINASDVGCGVDSDSEEECCRERSIDERVKKDKLRQYGHIARLWRTYFMHFLEWKINAGIVHVDSIASFPPSKPIVPIELIPDSPAAAIVSDQISEFRRQLKVLEMRFSPTGTTHDLQRGQVHDLREQLAAAEAEVQAIQKKLSQAQTSPVQGSAGAHPEDQLYATPQRQQAALSSAGVSIAQLQMGKVELSPEPPPEPVGPSAAEAAAATRLYTSRMSTVQKLSGVQLDHHQSTTLARECEAAIQRVSRSNNQEILARVSQGLEAPDQAELKRLYNEVKRSPPEDNQESSTLHWKANLEGKLVQKRAELLDIKAMELERAQQRLRQQRDSGTVTAAPSTSPSVETSGISVGVNPSPSPPVSSPGQIQQAIERGKQLAATLIRAAKTEGQTAIEIARMDTNKDGIIDRAEYMAAEGNDVDFDRYDRNSDGSLDRGELQLLAAEKLNESVQKRLEEERSARQKSQEELSVVKKQLAELQSQVTRQSRS